MPNKKGLGILCLYCATPIYSLYTHDYRVCPCGKVFVDGGKDYLRYGFPVGGKNMIVVIKRPNPAPKRVKPSAK